MSTQQLAEQVLEEMEDEFVHFDIVGLYQAGWFLSDKDVSPTQAREICLQVYRELTTRHPDAALVWVTWPNVEPEKATVAAPGTPLDFTLDPDDKPGPLLALARLNGEHAAD